MRTQRIIPAALCWSVIAFSAGLGRHQAFAGMMDVKAAAVSGAQMVPFSVDSANLSANETMNLFQTGIPQSGEIGNRAIPMRELESARPQAAAKASPIFSDQAKPADNAKSYGLVKNLAKSVKSIASGKSTNTANMNDVVRQGRQIFDLDETENARRADSNEADAPEHYNREGGIQGLAEPNSFPPDPTPTPAPVPAPVPAPSPQHPTGGQTLKGLIKPAAIVLLAAALIGGAALLAHLFFSVTMVHVGAASGAHLSSAQKPGSLK
ncbi:MAG: hypothetical protein ACYCPQ_04730 [Elusimicrobiota bacterium]